MTNFDQLLAEIAATSQGLNEAAEAASDVISDLDKRLVDAEPGVTVWQAVLLEDAGSTLNEDGTEQPTLRRATLGFAKVKSSKWGIAVREEVLGKKRARDNDFTEVLSREVTALRKADRDLRMLALPHLDGLLHAILECLQERAGKLIPQPAGAEDDAGAEGDLGITAEAV